MSESDQKHLSNPLSILPRKLLPNVDLRTLKDHPGNPKDHDIGAIHESMQANGVVDMIYVQDWPKTPRYIIAGHGRRETLLAAGITHDDVIAVKISPAAARRYVIASNRAAERGGWDDALLADYLKAQAEAGDLAGTGYDADDVDELLSALLPPSLDDLEAKHGAAGEDAAWPVYRVRLPHEVYEELTEAIEREHAASEHEAISSILAKAKRAEKLSKKSDRADSSKPVPARRKPRQKR